MKNKVLGTILLSTLLLSSAVSVSAATADTVKSSGSVNVDEGSIKPTDPDKPGDGGNDKDPEKPTDPVIPDVDPKDPGTGGFTPGNPDGGALTLLGASNLKFGTINISSNNIQKYAAPAKVLGATQDPTTGALTPTGTNKTVGNYVQFGDIRSEQTGYTLTAQLTKQFTLYDKDGKTPLGTLDNASINYTNGILTHEDGANITGGVDGLDLTSTMELVQDSGTAQQVVNLPSGKAPAKGILSVEYGQTKDYDDKYTVKGTAQKETEDKSIALKVPSRTATNMKKGNYLAEITWTLTDGQP